MAVQLEDMILTVKNVTRVQQNAKLKDFCKYDPTTGSNVEIIIKESVNFIGFQ